MKILNRPTIFLPLSHLAYLYRYRLKYRKSLLHSPPKLTEQVFLLPLRPQYNKAKHYCHIAQMSDPFGGDIH